MKSKSKVKVKIQKYDLGSFVADRNQNQMIGQFGQVGSIFGKALGDNAGGNFLSGAGAAAGLGAQLGSAIPGVGNVAGAIGGGLIGGVASLLGGASRRKQEAAITSQNKTNYGISYANQFNANTDSNNQNAYGNIGQFALGGLIGPSNPVHPADYLSKRYQQSPQQAPTYDPSLLNAGQFNTYKDDGSYGEWGKPYNPLPNEYVPIPMSSGQQILPSNKSIGLDNTYTPSRDRQQNNNIPILKSPTGRRYANGGDTQDNIINIQKGELLIDPATGKIKQEYNGINPLTGGLFQDHAKKGKDPIDNFTMADPGLFVITQAKAKSYKQSVDDNDKISQKTILMNIKNKKIELEGGLSQFPKFARGGYIDPSQLGHAGVGYENPEYYGGTPQVANIGPTGSSFSQSGDNSGTNFNGIASSIAQFSPSLLNIGQGLFGRVDTQSHVNPVVNPYTNKILSNLPQNVNLQPAINDIYNQQKVGFQDISNNTNSSAVARANKQQLYNNTGRQLGNIRMQGQQMNNEIANQRAGIYDQLGSQQAQYQTQAQQTNLGIDDLNARRRGAKQNILNTGLTQLQQVYADRQANNQRDAISKYALQLQQLMNPSTRFYQQFDPNYLSQQLR